MIASQNSCTPPGTPVDVTLARRKNASPSTIAAAMRSRQHRVGVDGQPEPVGLLWWPTSIAGFGGRIVSVIAVPLRSVGLQLGPALSFFITGSAVDSTSSTWNRAMPNTTPRPCGRKMNAMVNPTTVITSSRVAEFSAILRFSG